MVANIRKRTRENTGEQRREGVNEREEKNAVAVGTYVLGERDGRLAGRNAS